MSDTPFDPGDLAGTWLHSHEEDTDAGRVYRREGYEFPPSRGRDGFTLNADGSALISGPGPTDVPESGTAKWSLDGHRITITAEGATMRLEVIELEPKRLVAQPTSQS